VYLLTLKTKYDVPVEIRMGVRRVAERLSRGVVLRRRLPAKFRSLPILVTPEAGLRFWYRMSQVDPLLYKMAEELVKPGYAVWDVGANVGLFSFCAAARSGRSGFVLAIEPDFWLAQLIQRSSQELSGSRTDCSEVRVLCASASDSNRVAELAIAERARASNHLTEVTGASPSGGTRALQLSVSLTLDSLLQQFPPPTVLKIDVETHETSVLKGAGRLLKEIRPAIWCEVSTENSTIVTQLLQEAGYELFGAQTQPRQRTKRAWFQTLAIPKP